MADLEWNVDDLIESWNTGNLGHVAAELRRAPRSIVAEFAMALMRLYPETGQPELDRRRLVSLLREHDD